MGETKGSALRSRTHFGRRHRLKNEMLLKGDDSGPHTGWRSGHGSNLHARTARDPARRVALLSHIGKGNLGDELMFASALQNIRMRVQEVDFVSFTMVPEDTLARHPVAQAFPIRPVPPGLDKFTSKPLRVFARGTSMVRAAVREARFTQQCRDRLGDIDLVIFAGSGQFNDRWNSWRGYPRTLLRWTLASRWTKTPIAFLSQGAYTLESPISRMMIRTTVSLADYVSVRDTTSRDRVLATGVDRQIPIVPDLAFGFTRASPAAKGHGGASVLRIGVNPTPYFRRDYWDAVDQKRYDDYLLNLVDICCHIINSGHELVLYGTHEQADQMVIDDVLKAMRTRLDSDAMARVSNPRVQGLSSLWDILSSVDMVVASRYHGVISALLAGHATLALAYEEKTEDLMTALGLPSACAKISTLNSARAIAQLDQLISRREEIGAVVKAGVEKARLQVHQQFDEVAAHTLT